MVSSQKSDLSDNTPQKQIVRMRATIDDREETPVHAHAHAHTHTNQAQNAIHVSSNRALEMSNHELVSSKSDNNILSQGANESSHQNREKSGARVNSNNSRDSKSPMALYYEK